MSAGVHISWGGRLLPFGEQVLGGRGLTLQPGQPRLLIHTRHRLTRGQPLAHHCDDLAVGRRLLLQRPAGKQRQAPAHLGSGHDRIGAGAVAAGCLAVGAQRTVKSPSTW